MLKLATILVYIQAFMCVDGKLSVGYCNSYHYSWFVSNYDFALDLHLD